jgi:hypothetical protein
LPKSTTHDITKSNPTQPSSQQNDRRTKNSTQYASKKTQDPRPTRRHSPSAVNHRHPHDRYHFYPYRCFRDNNKTNNESNGKVPKNIPIHTRPEAGDFSRAAESRQDLWPQVTPCEVGEDAGI